LIWSAAIALSLMVAGAQSDFMNSCDHSPSATSRVSFRRFVAFYREVYMDPIRATDDLTRAVSKWFKTAVLQLDEERLKTLRACLHSEQTEVRVVACFRAGAVILEVINRADGTRSELFREDVGPLPLDDSR
jgi:hypothetical protein